MQVRVVISPRYDICFSLSDALAPGGSGFAQFRPETEPAWKKLAGQLGHAFWLAVPDALGHLPPEPSLDEFLHALREVPDDLFVERVVGGLTQDLFLDRPGGRRVPPEDERAEWLNYIGGGNSLAVPQRSAADIKKLCLRALEAFGSVFLPVWEAQREKMEVSRKSVKALARTLPVERLARTLFLKADFDERRGQVRALRGGCVVDTDSKTRLFLIPSAFNYRRLWSAAVTADRSTLFFPYFDRALSLTGDGAETNPVDLDYDPYLVCRAIADPTRYRILRMLAAEELPAARIRETLGLSKANISHHLFQLREAGLVSERQNGRASYLSIRRSAVARLPQALFTALGLTANEEVTQAGPTG